MTDTKTITDEDRRKALDVFADKPNVNQSPDQFANALIEVTNRLPGEARVFGAQRVAVSRDLAKVRKNLMVLAGMAGNDWFYRFPVKDKGSKKSIEGPSIKLANEVAREFGNCDVDCRAYDLGDSWLFHARFQDLETGFSLTRPFQQRKSQASLKTRDPSRAEDIAFQIGVSKAIRNVICNALQSLCDFAFEQARGEMVTKIGKNLKHYREKVAERLGELSIDPARVEAAVEKPIGKWVASDIAKVIAELQAIQDGMAVAEDIWPDVSRETKGAPEIEGEVKMGEFSGMKKAVPPTLLQFRTQLWTRGSLDAIEEWWQTNVKPWLDHLTPQVRKQLEAEMADRMSKVEADSGKPS